MDCNDYTGPELALVWAVAWRQRQRDTLRHLDTYLASNKQPLIRLILELDDFEPFESFEESTVILLPSSFDQPSFSATITCSTNYDQTVILLILLILSHPPHPYSQKAKTAFSSVPTVKKTARSVHQMVAQWSHRLPVYLLVGN